MTSLRTGIGTRSGRSSRGALRQLGGRTQDGLQQRLVRLGARLEAGGLLEVADRSVRLRTIEAVDHAIIVAAARQLALNIVDDLAGRARRGRGGDSWPAERPAPARPAADAQLRPGRSPSPPPAFTGTRAPLNIGAGCEPDCMNSTLIRIATVTKAPAAKPTASLGLHPSARNTCGRRSPSPRPPCPRPARAS